MAIHIVLIPKMLVCYIASWYMCSYASNPNNCKIRHTVLASEVVWEIAVLEGIWAATGIEREVGAVDVTGG